MSTTPGSSSGAAPITPRRKKVGSWTCYMPLCVSCCLLHEAGRTYVCSLFYELVVFLVEFKTKKNVFAGWLFCWLLFAGWLNCVRGGTVKHGRSTTPSERCPCFPGWLIHLPVRSPVPLFFFLLFCVQGCRCVIVHSVVLRWHALTQLHLSIAMSPIPARQ